MINLTGAHIEGFFDFRDWPFFDHMEIKNLILLATDLLLDSLDGSLDESICPLLIPDGIEIEPRRIGNTVNRGSPTFRVIGVTGLSGGMPLPSA